MWWTNTKTECYRSSVSSFQETIWLWFIRVTKRSKKNIQFLLPFRIVMEFSLYYVNFDATYDVDIYEYKFCIFFCLSILPFPLMLPNLVGAVT